MIVEWLGLKACWRLSKFSIKKSLSFLYNNFSKIEENAYNFDTGL